MSDGRHISTTLPIVLAVVIHGALAGGVEGAKRLGWFAPKPRPQVVEFVVEKPKAKPPEPPPPPPRVDPPKPPEPPPPVEPPKPKIARKVDPKAPPPEPEPEVPPTPEPPAPGPASPEAPPSEYTYKMPAGTGGGSMGVQAGARPTGSARGVKGGKGTTGTGGGAPEGSQGTGGEPRAASIASVKSQPDPIGDYDHVTLEKKDYPAEAVAAGIEGDVQVKILVDAEGNPTSVKLIKGLGHGLDQKAIALAKKLRFRPALDTNDKPVAFWVPWTFHFRLPD